MRGRDCRRAAIVGSGGLALALALVAAAPANAASCSVAGPDDPTFEPRLAITGTLPTALEGGYVYLPFRVPQGATAVRVRYCHDQPEAQVPAAPNAPQHVLDLGIYEARPNRGRIWGMEQLRGWAGSSVKDATVSPNRHSPDAIYEQDRKAHVTGFTTRGYEPGPIPAGEWAVELGVAAVADRSEGDAQGEVEFRVEIELSDRRAWSDRRWSRKRYDGKPARREPGWYAGDFHVHGEHEPGNATMRESFDYAFGPYGGQGAGLDFVTLVDHNNVVAYDELGRYQDDYPGKLIARSTEVTTYRGHLQNHVSGENVEYRTGPLFVGELRAGGGESTLEPIDPASPARAERPVRKLFEEVKAERGFTQINHPTIFPSAVPTFEDFCRGCAWDYSARETDYSLVDAVEIATGPAGLQTDPSPGPNPFTPLAIEFWEDAIDVGGRNANHIAAVGSSDSHRAPKRSEINPVTQVTEAPIGMATTVVRAHELSETGIKRGVKRAHTYVKVWGLDGPDVRLEGRGGDGERAIIGQRLAARNAEFTARVFNLDAARGARPGSYTLVVFKDGEPYAGAPIPPSGDTFEFEFSGDGAGRYRLQIQREGAIETVSSPIWVETPGGAGGCERGDRKGDRMRGGPRDDCLKGRRGHDRLRGRGGDDRLFGGRGRDRLSGGPGNDRLRGGGARDRVRCGPGRDLVLSDGHDRIARDCERVRRG